MTLIQKIKFLREERFHDLNDWEQGFIEDLYGIIDSVQDPTEEEAEEFFSTRQIEKLNEIWENLGL